MTALYLLEFAIHHNVPGYEKCTRVGEGETTASVVSRVIIPESQSSGQSMILAGKVDRHSVRKATMFVSHAWGCSFWSLVQAVVVIQDTL